LKNIFPSPPAPDGDESLETKSQKMKAIPSINSLSRKSGGKKFEMSGFALKGMQYY